MKKTTSELLRLINVEFTYEIKITLERVIDEGNQR